MNPYLAFAIYTVVLLICGIGIGSVRARYYKAKAERLEQQITLGVNHRTQAFWTEMYQ